MSKLDVPTNPGLGELYCNKHAGFYVKWGGDNIGWIPVLNDDGTPWGFAPPKNHKSLREPIEKIIEHVNY